MNCIELYKQERDITPANKCIKKQQFYSTKRKRLSKVRLGKPTIKEKNEIASTLLSQVSLSMPEFELSFLLFYYYYNNITYFVLSITGILVAVCSKEGVDNLATNGTLIALQHIMNEDDMALEVLHSKNDYVKMTHFVKMTYCQGNKSMLLLHTSSYYNKLLLH